MADRLCVHSAGRIAGFPEPSLWKHPDDHAGERAVARRGSQFCGVGTVAWSLTGDPPGLAESTAATGGSAVVVTRRSLVDNVCGGQSGLGIFLHGCADSVFLFQAAADG